MNNDLLNEVVGILEESSFFFRTGNIKKGYGMIQQLIDKLVSLTGTIKKSEDIVVINEFLRAAIEALDNKDFVFCSDILQYGLRLKLVSVAD